MSFAVEANLLAKQFGQVRALDGVSFNIKPGEIYGLIGPNSSGKNYKDIVMKSYRNLNKFVNWIIRGR